MIGTAVPCLRYVRGGRGYAPGRGEVDVERRPPVPPLVCKLLIVGAGAGGCSVAWRLAPSFKGKCVIVLDPSKVHYYQPAFTLVASGLQNIGDCQKPTNTLLPPTVTWVKDAAEQFDPCNCLVITKGGDKVYYDYMVVAIGIHNDYSKITGLKAALDDPTSRVSTIYSPQHCEKTWCTVRDFNGGHAVFTFPRQGGKCAGAALKIMYLAHDYWRKNNILDTTNITYNSGSTDIFGIPKYAQALIKLTSKRNIAVNFCMNLVEVRPCEAMFLGKEGEIISFPYKMLHVTPPMSTPACLSTCTELANNTGYLEVDHHTLQHKTFPNIFGLGDCTCTPNSKTAAAVGPQSYVVAKNLSSVMKGREPIAKYDGYGACPLLTSYNRGILAEFLYDKQLRETFPFDQSKERRIFFPMSTQVFPRIYWKYLLKGKWSGPGTLRKIMKPFS